MTVETSLAGGDAEVEEVTLLCLQQNLSAQSWYENVQRIANRSHWDKKQRLMVADVLLRLLFIDSLAAFILQCIAFIIRESNSATNAELPFCTETDLCEALLVRRADQLFSNDVFESLSSILNSSKVAIHLPFSSINCLASIRLLQKATILQIDSLRHLALRILANFCLELETSQSVDSISPEEQKECIECISINIEKASTTEVLILENLRRLVEARWNDSTHVTNSNGIWKKASKWNEEENLAHFNHLFSNASAEAKASITKSLPANATSPEMVNLVYFLVDSYSDWQSKMDAVNFLFRACLSNDRTLQHLLYELFYITSSACAIIAGTPTSLGGNESYTSTWRSALCGLLPCIVVSLMLDSRLQSSLPTSDVDLVTIVKDLLSEPSNALVNCEVMLVSPEEKKKQKGKEGIAADSEVDMMLDAFIGTDEGPSRQPVRAALLRSLQNHQLLSRQAIASLDGLDGIKNDARDLPASYMDEFSEGQRSNSNETMTLFEQKLHLEIQEESDLLARIAEDYACQYAFSIALIKVIADCISSSELDNLARLCKLLTNDLTTLDMCLLYVSSEQLLHPIAGLMEEGGNDLLQNGEEPSVLGAILLFAQVIVDKSLTANYNTEKLLPAQSYSFMNVWIRSSSSASVLASMNHTDQSIISSWITALFDSDGISDDLIKSSSPWTMLRLTPSLFMQSINACCQGVIDMETLRGGFTYFLQDLLSYTLPGAINWLLLDLSRCQHEDINSPFQDESSKAMRKKNRDIRLEVLSMLLTSESCPFIVQKLVSNRVVEVLKVYLNTSEVAEKVMMIMQTYSESTRTTKTHLWVKISQAQMKLCNVDALLSLDVSFDVLRCSRGLASALHVVNGTLLSYPRSSSLCRAVASSLCLAHLQDAPQITLIEDVIVAFTNGIFEPNYGSIVPTLALLLRMLKLNDNESKTRSFIEAVEALVALKLRQLLKRARGEHEVARIFDQFRILLQQYSSEESTESLMRILQQ